MPTLPSRLRRLNASHNALTSTRSIGPHKKLRHLVLDENPLEDLEGLDELPALETLSLRDTPLRFPTLPSINALRVVDLSRSPIERLEVLPPYLTRLVLDDSALKSARALAPCSVLSELSLTGSALEDLKGIARFPSLRALKLAHTALRSLDDLPPLSELELLDVRGLSCRLEFASEEFPRLTQVIA